MSDDALKKVISESKAKGVELEIAALSRRITPSQNFRSATERCLSLLRTNAADHWSGGRASLELCGSFVQGTAIEGCQVDMLLRLDQAMTPEEYARSLAGFKMRIKAQMAIFCTVESPQQVFPHSAAVFALHLAPIPNTPPMMFNILATESLPDPSKPSLTLDSVITKLCDCCAVSRDFLRLIKLWACNQGFTNLLDGFMNGTAWSLLGLFFLQKMSVLPPYAAIADEKAPPPLVSASPMPGLLYDFFLWLSGVADSEQRGFSLCDGQEFSVPAPTEGGAHVTLFIEDPAELSSKSVQRNCSEKVVEHQLARVCQVASETAHRLQPSPVRWYNWSEVFDPNPARADNRYSMRDGLGAVQGFRSKNVPDDCGSFEWLDNYHGSWEANGGQHGY